METKSENLIERVSVPALDMLLGVKFPVLDKGFIRVVDYLGGDDAIVQAARVSYGRGTKQRTEDEGLIRFLIRHRHCYAGWMQVLTSEGWKRWDHCNWNEEFLVPNPKTRTLRREKLPLEMFSADEELVTFENQRMSFAVTGDHRMWFKGKYQDEFDIVRASQMAKWGHFDPLSGYTLESDKHDTQLDPACAFLGFVLGDGSFSGKNNITFHLKKDRKKEYLASVLRDLNIEADRRQSTTYRDAEIFTVRLANKPRLRRLFEEHTTWGARAVDKCLRQIKDLTPGQAASVCDGLINSDGSEKDDRPQIEFFSSSPKLADAWQTLHAMAGIDAHRVAMDQDDGFRSVAYHGDRTSLEARKQYFGTRHYRGHVFCATTSTGLLMVRGGPDKFAFVCGNTTPFEMCELKLHVRVPMDCWRQWIRHRMANVNEYSTRYSVAPEDRQQTKADQWRLQSDTNKQGSRSPLTSWVDLNIDPDVEGFGGWASPGEYLTVEEKRFHSAAQELYDQRIDFGVAREQARKDLPLSTYTEAYWKIDLHNLLHFLRLRMHAAAQLEIRSYADVIGQAIVAQWVPLTWAAFRDYRLNALTLSARDQTIIKCVVNDSWQEACEIAQSQFGWLEKKKRGADDWKSNREREECEVKLTQLDLTIPWAVNAGITPIIPEGAKQTP